MSRATDIELAAAHWVSRLHGPAVDHDAWEAFDAWLSTSPDHQLAFDEALILSLKAEERAAQVLAEIDAPSPALSAPRRAPRPAARRPFFFSPAGMGWGLGLAASAVAAAVLVAVVPWQGGAYTTYSTAKGERRTVTLADGSRVDLDAGSTMRVRLDGKTRQVILGDAQAVFDVTHDPARPFLITAGDETVRVVGTQFDVRHRDGQVAVTVARGLVEVSPNAGASSSRSPVRLRPGQRLDHREGDATSPLSQVNPAEVFGWRTGRLIYRDAPLSEVAGDLSRYGAQPIRLAGGAATLRFSGVIIVGDQGEMLNRLTNLLPISETKTQEAIILRSR